MKKVLVAMSGGVDSSVAAGLLKEQGYFVVGAYMKNFSPESWAGVIEADCPWEQDVADAKAVCDKLGIEFRSFNFEKEYAEKVIEYFFAEYAAGRTPNPDIMCNKEIKFGLFLDKALELGFDYVATGHYARIRTTSPHHLGRGVSLSRRWRGIKGEVEYELLKGPDPKKDQSYFLYALNQEQLSKALFPIGEYTKPQVRELASEFGLQNAEKKDSQGVCFIGHIKLREFLRQRIPEKVGQIVEASSGKVIGTHPGAWYYTVGQREGIGIGGGKPYYVAQKDVISNKLVVTKKSLVFELVEKQGLYSRTAIVRDIHWVDPNFSMSRFSNIGYSCKAKIRYQQPDQTCTVSLTNTDSQRLSADKSAKVRVRFAELQFAIAPGQSIVFYKGDRVLGGGVIQ